MWPLVLSCVAVVVVAGLVLWFVFDRLMSKMFEGINPFEGITEADWKQMNAGLERRYPLDYEVVVKVFDRETLEKYYGAAFDQNGDVCDLTNEDSIIKGFVSSLVEMDGFLNTLALIRERLGLNDPFYDETYGSDIYVMTVDLSDQNLRFDFPVNETAGELALFQEGGVTSGGAREVQIMRPIPAWTRIVEIRRVCQEGYGKPFTPNESSKHTIVEYRHRNSKTGDLEMWNPWHDEDEGAWAVPLLRLKPAIEFSVSIEHIRVQGEGVELHVARAGEGPPVILLHGFPENWRSWHHQIPALVHAGFSVWAPDLRGYNLSEKPAGREPYHLRHLIEDVAAIVRATGQPRAQIVGHDWGGIIAWTFAGHFPELVEKLVILNAPHMQIYMEHVFRVPQIFRSWYVLFFQLPWIPELLISAANYFVVRMMFRHYPARKGAFSEEDIDQYVEALSQPGALTAALNYYRENLRATGSSLARSARTDAETLIIWGERDSALGVELLDGLDRMAPCVKIQRIPDAGHWVQNEAPEEVNEMMISFLRGESGGN